MFKQILVILLIFSFIFPKEYCYSEEEVIEIHDIINECDFKEQVHFKVEENLSNQIKNLELNVEKHKVLVKELETQLKLKDDLIKEVKPKWHENKYLWFFGGILITSGSVYLAGQIK